MQCRFDLEKFKSLYRFNTNSYVSQQLGISIHAVRRRADYHGVRKDPDFLKLLRAKAGRIGGGRRWTHEKNI